MRVWKWAMASAALASMIPAGAAAQSGADIPVLLDTVEVRIADEAATGVGGTVTTTTTTRRTIDNRMIEDLGDLERVEPGVSFNRADRSVNIRGLSGPRVLTTIDGIRVPYLLDTTRGATGGPDAFDFQTLSAFDITRGADPLLGSGALGGALALRTLDPEDLLLGGRPVGVVTKSGYDSVDRSWFNSSAGAVRVGDTSILVQGGIRRGEERGSQGDLDVFGAERTAPNPMDYEQYNGLAKIHHTIEGGHRLSLVGELFHREDETDVRTTQSLLNPAVRGSGNYLPGDYRGIEEVERRRVSIGYDYAAPVLGTGWADLASATLYWQETSRANRIDAVRSQSVVGPFTRDNSIDQETLGFNGFAERGFVTGPVSHRLTLGADIEGSVSEQYTAGSDACALGRPRDRFSCLFLKTNQADAPKVGSTSIGLFAENEIALLDGRFRITPGARFDWYEREPQLTEAYERNADFSGLPSAASQTAVSPKLTFAYDVLPGLTGHASYREGFRAPSVGELYSSFGGVGTYLRTGNPDLEPETSRGFDIGLTAGDESFGAFVNLFRTEYDDFIDVVVVAPAGGLYPLGGVSSYRNIPRARITGAELGGHLRFAEGWTARASLAYAKGENVSDGTPLDTVAPVTALLGLGYEGPEWGAEASARLVGRRDRVDEGFAAPGYGVADLTAWYEPERLPGLKLTGGVFNLFDKTYYDAVNVPLSRSQPDLFYSEPGRSFRVNAAYRF